MDLDRRVVWVALYTYLLLVGFLLIALFVRSLVRALLLAVILFPAAAAAAAALQFLFLFTPQPQHVALVTWPGGERLVRPGEWVVILPLWHRVAREIPLRDWDVPVQLSGAVTRDGLPVQCSLYVSCRFDPWLSDNPCRTVQEYDDQAWQAKVQRAVHDALLRYLREMTSSELLGPDAFDRLERLLRERVAPSLAPFGAAIEGFYWQRVQPLPAVQKALDRLKEARSEGQAVYNQLRELSRRFRIRPEDAMDLLMLALTIALTREGEDHTRVNLSLRVSPDEREPELDDR